MFDPASKTEKVSDRIIEQIRDLVLSGEVKPGDRLASEKELVDQFEVSKATMREALRVLEVMGLVEIRKGIAGGVFIAEVDMKTTIHGMMDFLHFRNVSIRDITMLRFMLEPSVAHLAALRVTDEDIARLERMIAHDDDPDSEQMSRDIGFHRHLARLTNNPILILIMDFVENILKDVKFKLNLGTDFYREVHRSHRAILDCLKRRDAAGARREIAADLLSVGNHMADRSGAPRFEPEVLGLDQGALYKTNPACSETQLPPGASEFLAALAGVGIDPGSLSRSKLLKDLGGGGLYMLLPGDDED